MGYAEIEERLYQLVERFEQHEENEEQVIADLFKSQQANTDAIAEITRSVSRLVDDTSDVIRLHRDLQGAARVGKGIQGFMLWCLKWGTIGVGIAATVTWIVEKFNHAG